MDILDVQNEETQNAEVESSIIDTSFVERLTELPITNREKQVLLNLAKGLTNKQISEVMKLSISTIRNHVANIFIKLRISNRSQATAIAIYSGLVKPSDFDE